jgi:tetratricopeptide (TPR) repeat protein
MENSRAGKQGMNEESERPSTGAGTGPVWSALGAGDRAKVNAFLDEQTRLAREQADVARLQAESFRREDRLRLWSLRVHHVSGVMKLAFELALAFIFVTVAVGVGGLIWSAAEDSGLVIEAFSVPPDLAGRGLNGEVVAARLLDKLSSLQAETVSNRAPSSYAHNWGSDIKLQIPDTGISVGEFTRTLHAWLGHQTRITGEIYHVPTGIAVTARAGSDTSPTFIGSESDLDTLLQKAAESIYHATQPYRYVVYLMNVNRTREAEAAANSLIANGSLQDRAWAYVGLANVYSGEGDLTRAMGALQSALALRPDFIMAYQNIGGIEGQLQHDEASLAATSTLVALTRQRKDTDLSDQSWKFNPALAESGLAADLGDFRGQIETNRRIETLPEFSGSVENARQADIIAFAWMHDPRSEFERYTALPSSANPQVLLVREAVLTISDLIAGRWQTALKKRAKLESGLSILGATGKIAASRQLGPWTALALAMSGDLAGAHRLIDTTPVDCTICLRVRGRIDTIEKNWRGADYWFSRAVHDAPSPPFAWTDWGRALLLKGDLDAAIAKLNAAHMRGPRFADPLEMWGEALIAKNWSDLAIDKFSEAAKDAPNWGRLHLKWGEALHYAGRDDEARGQFALAARLDLSPAERSELGRMRRVHD